MAEAAKRSATGRVRGERLETRVTADQKRLIEHAAALQGRTVTDFVLTSVQDAARRAIAALHPACDVEGNQTLSSLFCAPTIKKAVNI